MKMKKILTILFVLLISFVSVGQEYDTTLKFLGIPIDGKKSDMIASIKLQGFREVPDSELLIGEFNGLESHIGLAENRGKVYRVVVFDAQTRDEGQIRIRYNNLIRQFENSNGKYFSLFPNEPIPEEEDISYEILVHQKQYQAAFHYNPIYNDEDAKNKLIKETTEECRQLVEETKDNKTIGDITLGEFYSDEDNFKNLVAITAGQKVFKMSNSLVWFTICEHRGEYYIGLYYDNLDNKVSGEDL